MANIQTLPDFHHYLSSVKREEAFF